MTKRKKRAYKDELRHLLNALFVKDQGAEHFVLMSRVNIPSRDAGLSLPQLILAAMTEPVQNDVGCNLHSSSMDRDGLTPLHVTFDIKHCSFFDKESFKYHSCKKLVEGEVHEREGDWRLSVTTVQCTRRCLVKWPVDDSALLFGVSKGKAESISKRLHSFNIQQCKKRPPARGCLSTSLVVAEQPLSESSPGVLLSGSEVKEVDPGDAETKAGQESTGSKQGLSGIALCLGFYKDLQCPQSFDTIRLQALQQHQNLLTISVNDRPGNDHHMNRSHHIHACWTTTRGRNSILSGLRRIMADTALPLRACFVDYYYIPQGAYAEAYYNTGMALLLQNMLEQQAKVYVMRMPGSGLVANSLTAQGFLHSCGIALANPLFEATVHTGLKMALEQPKEALIFRPQ